MNIFQNLLAKGKSYVLAGDGYCDDWVYLPEGKYPALISDVSNTLYNEDRIQECMNRCTNAAKTSAKISNKAFYIKSDRRCGCSSGACSTRKGSGYTSYFTVEVSVQSLCRFVCSNKLKLSLLQFKKSLIYIQCF